MIVSLKNTANEEQIQNLITWIESQGIDVHISRGRYQTLLGLIGDTHKVDTDLLESLDIVSGVKRITEPFKSVNRKFHPDLSSSVW